MPKEFTLERVTDALTLIAAAAPALAAPCLFFPWHTVQPASPALLFDHTDARGGRMLALDPSESFTCSGLAHLQIGAWPFVILLVSTATALVTRRARSRAANLAAVLASLGAAALLLWLELICQLLAHLFDRVGPSRFAERTFDGSVTLAACCFIALAALRATLTFRAHAHPR